ncbi:MAG: hypothetical protein ACE5G1_09820 [bacterium]
MRRIWKMSGLMLTIALFLFQMSCSSNPASSNPTSGTVKISVKSSTAPLNKLAGAISITSARVVIEKIRFDSVIDDSLDFRFKQPFVQDLMLATQLQQIETVQVPFGTYKKSKIEIDDLEPEDGLAYTQNPDLQDRSVFIQGTFDGVPFTFTSDFSEEQERELQPRLVLDENSPSTNIVLVLNMGNWFVDENGNLLNPLSPDNRSKIEKSIKDSIDIFEDDDDDGERDD